MDSKSESIKMINLFYFYQTTRIRSIDWYLNLQVLGLFAFSEILYLFLCEEGSLKTDLKNRILQQTDFLSLVYRRVVFFVEQDLFLGDRKSVV